MNTDTLLSKQINSEYPIISTDSSVFKALQLPYILTQEILHKKETQDNIDMNKLSKDELILSLKDEIKHLRKELDTTKQDLELTKITSTAISDYVVAINREVESINNMLNECYIPKSDTENKKYTVSERFKVMLGRYIHGLQERIALLEMIGKQ